MEQLVRIACINKLDPNRFLIVEGGGKGRVVVTDSGRVSKPEPIADLLAGGKNQWTPISREREAEVLSEVSAILRQQAADPE